MGGRGGGSPATREAQDQPTVAQSVPPVPTAPGNLDQRVLAAYDSLASSPNGLVSLVRLRDRLSDVSREDLDRTLKVMDRSRVIQLSPDPNQKALPPEARRDALRLGGSDQHFISR